MGSGLSLLQLFRNIEWNASYTWDEALLVLFPSVSHKSYLLPRLFGLFSCTLFPVALYSKPLATTVHFYTHVLKMKGFFITFEGIDGSGKTTQAKRLDDFLTSQGRRVVFTREPGGTEVSEKIRTILLDGANHHMAWLTEMFLYMASRAQHTEEVIRPALDEGAIVISDRYMDATMAYQGYGRGLDRDIIRRLNTIATSSIVPDVTIVVDLSPEMCFERMAAIHKRADRMEGAGQDFQRRVREGYLELVKQEPDRVRVIDGAKSISELEKEVRQIVCSLLS